MIVDGEAEAHASFLLLSCLQIGLSNENMKKIQEMHAGYYAGSVRFVVIANAETNQIAQMTMWMQSWTPDDLPIVAVVDHTYGNRELKKANSIKLKAFLEEMEECWKSRVPTFNVANNFRVFICICWVVI